MSCRARSIGRICFCDASVSWFSTGFDPTRTSCRSRAALSGREFDNSIKRCRPTLDLRFSAGEGTGAGGANPAQRAGISFPGRSSETRRSLITSPQITFMVLHSVSRGRVSASSAATAFAGSANPRGVVSAWDRRGPRNHLWFGSSCGPSERSEAKDVTSLVLEWRALA